MEFDNMLVSKFRESNMIAQQLINLNFLFNMEDISYILKEKLLGKHIGISMKVLYDGKYLPIKDFYTNYTDIPVYRVDRASMSRSKNVCDYMGDNKIIDYIHTNKFTQPIFHWSMVENPSYIYNFYDGFAPVFSNGGDYQRLQGRYYDQADISQEKHTVYNSAASWCKLMDGTGLTAAMIMGYDMSVQQDPSHYASQLYINTDTGIAYLNNNRYNISKLVMDNYSFDSWKKPVYMYSSIQEEGNIDMDDGHVNPDAEFGLIIRDMDDKIILHFESVDIVHATYRNFKGLIKSALNDPNREVKYSDTDNRVMFQIRMADGTVPTGVDELVLQLLRDMYDVWVPPYKIKFTKSTITSPVDAFEDYHPEECNMYKYNNHDGYVLRYTSSLCPMFIDTNDEYYKNIVYRYNQWGNITEADVQQYNKMLKTGMTPDYPSLGYYNFAGEKDLLSIPRWYFDNSWPWDITWKNESVLYVMPEKYETSFIEYNPIAFNEKQEEDVMWALLYDYITGLGIDVSTVWMKHKLKSLYKISYNFDYVDDRNIDKIKYTVRFDLR